MRGLRVFVFVLAAAVLRGPAWADSVTPAATVVATAAPAAKVATLLDDWVDTARGRTLPVKVYYPASGDGPFPVVVVSHGLGGTREGIAYLGEYFAAHGYISLHVQHPGSDDSAWRGKMRPMASMRKAATDLDNILDRPKDVTFVLDEAERRAKAGDALWAKADFTRVAVAGHSFGAFTALAAAGRELKGPMGNMSVNLGDPRIKACIALSAPASAREAKNGSYDTIKVPCLHMTGTEDNSPIGETSAKDRRIPFDSINGADQYLLTFKGGDHMIFNGPRKRTGLAALRGSSISVETEARYEKLIEECTTEFLDASLRGDKPALFFLQDGGFARELGIDGVWEVKKLGK